MKIFKTIKFRIREIRDSKNESTFIPERLETSIADAADKKPLWINVNKPNQYEYFLSYDGALNKIKEFIKENTPATEIIYDLPNLMMTIDYVNYFDDIPYMRKVKEAYKFINDLLCDNMLMNNEDTRLLVRVKLQAKLEIESTGNVSIFQVKVKCNEENNPPDVIDNNLLTARVIRKKNNIIGYKFIDLVFGNEQQVRDYNIQHYFDNENFKFIEKGL